MQSNIFSLSFFVSLIASTIRLATPILIPALGQIYTQRAGILNLGVEGTMLIGAIAAFSVAAATGSLWLGILSGITAGILFSLIFAWLTITVRGIRAAHAAGMKVVGITSTFDKEYLIANGNPDYIISSLNELPDILDSAK